VTTARLALNLALTLEPNNMYLRFLDRKQRAAARAGNQ
jgi:hypothetical protein